MSGLVLPESIVDDCVAEARSIVGGNRVIAVSDVRWIVHGAIFATRAELDARRAQEAISREAVPRPSTPTRRPGAGRRKRRRRR